MGRWHKLEQRDIEHIAKDVVEHGLPTKYVADLFGVSQRRVQQIAKYYRETGEVPILKKPGRKPYRKYSRRLEEVIEMYAKKHGLGATGIAKLLRRKRGIKIDNNYVHKVLKMKGLAREERNKKGRKRPWVRYEREHSLSAVHMDWYYNSELDVWVCPVLDDASRFLLAIIETKSATAEASIKVLNEAYEKYSYLRPIQEVVVDHGTQFTANRRDKRGKVKHRFEKYCEEKGIKLVFTRYNHPQSNGKVERFFQTYQRFRGKFASVEEFRDWYNRVRPHFSLDLRTPEKVFYEKVADIVFGEFWNFAERQQEVMSDD